MSRSLLPFALPGLLIFAVGIASPTAPARACCMVPRTYHGHIGQSAQQAVLFWDHGREDLILKVNYHITGAAMPDNFAWIISVPSEPDAYAVADPRIFDQVPEWAHQIVSPPPSRGRTLGGIVAASIPHSALELGTRVHVGPYDIQPVRAHGPGAFAALNAWLGPHGFPIEPAAHMAYFIQHGFTFLCIRVNPPSHQKTVDPAAGVVPLHLSFRTDRPYYPLKYSSRQGVFDVSLYVFTRGGLDYSKSMDSLTRMNWDSQALRRGVPTRADTFPEALKTVYRTPQFGLRAGGPIWNLDVIDATAVNSVRPISRWTDDVFFGTRTRLARR